MTMGQNSDSHPEDGGTRASSAPARPNVSTDTRSTGEIRRQWLLSRGDEIKAEDPEDSIQSVRPRVSFGIRNTAKKTTVKKEDVASLNVNNIMPVHQKKSPEERYCELNCWRW